MILEVCNDKFRCDNIAQARKIAELVQNDYREFGGAIFKLNGTTLTLAELNNMKDNRASGVIEIHAGRFGPSVKSDAPFHAILTDANPKPGNHLQPLAASGSDEAQKAERAVVTKLDHSGWDGKNFLKYVDQETRKIKVETDSLNLLQRRVKNVNRWIANCNIQIQDKDGSYSDALDAQQLEECKKQIPECLTNRTKFATAFASKANKFKFECEIF